MIELDATEDKSWMRYSACLGISPSVFFPERGDNQRPAIVICRGCRVRAQCLEFALRHRIDDGIWGGESERSRRRILKARRSAA